MPADWLDFVSRELRLMVITHNVMICLAAWVFYRASLPRFLCPKDFADFSEHKRNRPVVR